MNTNEKQYYIFFRANEEKIPVTKEQFEDYYNEVNVFRRRMQRNGECSCPRDKRLFCDTDCAICPYRCDKKLSLNASLNAQSDEITFLDLLPDADALTESIALDAVEAAQLFKRLCELMPEAVEIGKLRIAGLADTEIEKLIGINDATFKYRIKKVKNILSKEFPDFF